MEYMAFGLPVVAFDLKETRVSAEAAASYVPSGDVAAYARAIVELLDDDDKREVMGREGRRRIEDELAWSYQRDAYVDVYDTLVGRTRTTPAPQPRVIRLPAEEPAGDRSRDRVRG
jgi:glycosyltransferase involved in cell wall biosynthesis